MQGELEARLIVEEGARGVAKSREVYASHAVFVHKSGKDFVRVTLDVLVERRLYPHTGDPVLLSAISRAMFPADGSLF